MICILSPDVRICLDSQIVLRSLFDYPSRTAIIFTGPHLFLYKLIIPQSVVYEVNQKLKCSEIFEKIDRKSNGKLAMSFWKKQISLFGVKSTLDYVFDLDNLREIICRDSKDQPILEEVRRINPNYFVCCDRDFEALRDDLPFEIIGMTDFIKKYDALHVPSSKK